MPAPVQTPPHPSPPGVVLDLFGGTGTTALVAALHGRIGISVDASADYCRLATWRASDPTSAPKPPHQQRRSPPADRTDREARRGAV